MSVDDDDRWMYPEPIVLRGEDAEVFLDAVLSDEPREISPVWKRLKERYGKMVISDAGKAERYRVKVKLYFCKKCGKYHDECRSCDIPPIVSCECSCGVECVELEFEDDKN